MDWSGEGRGYLRGEELVAGFDFWGGGVRDDGTSFSLFHFRHTTYYMNYCIFLLAWADMDGLGWGR